MDRTITPSHGISFDVAKTFSLSLFFFLFFNIFYFIPSISDKSKLLVSVVPAPIFRSKLW